MGWYENMMTEVDALETSVSDNASPVPLENPIPEPLEIYFVDLPTDKQDKIMAGLESILNASAADKITVDKISLALAEKPIMVLDLEELRRTLGQV